MRVLVFGSRTFEDRAIIFSVLDGLFLSHTLDCALVGEDSEFVVIEGQCPYGGADAHAESWVKMAMHGHPMIPFGGPVVHEPHPADWDRLKKAAGPIRNEEMAKSGANIALGFIDKPLAESRGSASMKRHAKDAGIPTYVIEKVN